MNTYKLIYLACQQAHEQRQANRWSQPINRIYWCAPMLGILPSILNSTKRCNLVWVMVIYYHYLAFESVFHGSKSEQKFHPHLLWISTPASVHPRAISSSSSDSIRAMMRRIYAVLSVVPQALWALLQSLKTNKPLIQIKVVEAEVRDKNLERYKWFVPQAIRAENYHYEKDWDIASLPNHDLPLEVLGIDGGLLL